MGKLRHKQAGNLLAIPLAMEVDPRLYELHQGGLFIGKHHLMVFGAVFWVPMC